MQIFNEKNPAPHQYVPDRNAETQAKIDRLFKTYNIVIDPTDVMACAMRALIDTTAAYFRLIRDGEDSEIDIFKVDYEDRFNNILGALADAYYEAGPKIRLMRSASGGQPQPPSGRLN